MIVKVFSRDECRICTQAKEFLDGMEIEFIEEHQAAGEVPQIYAGDTHIGGYEDLLALSQSINDWEETFNG